MAETTTIVVTWTDGKKCVLADVVKGSVKRRVKQAAAATGKTYASAVEGEDYKRTLDKPKKGR